MISANFGVSSWFLGEDGFQDRRWGVLIGDEAGPWNTGVSPRDRWSLLFSGGAMEKLLKLLLHVPSLVHFCSSITALVVAIQWNW